MRLLCTRNGFGQLLLCATTLLGAPIASLAQQIDVDRYERAPVITEDLLPPVSEKGLLEDPEQVPPNFIRWIGGLDQTPVAITPEMAARDLQDPFGEALLSQTNILPADVETVLKMLGEPDLPDTALSDQTVYIVSASGQITVEQAPDLPRRPRAVILRRDDRAQEAVFVAPSMNQLGTLEVMGWDAQKGLFNYYERVLLDPSGPQFAWIWRGDSSHAWRDETRDHSCFVCHRSGEVNMKELRVPWQNWHSQSATIKPESIPADSPLRLNPIFAIEPPSSFLRGGDEFERVTNQWIAKSNKTRVDRIENGELDVLHAVRPFFETSTAQLISSVEQSSANSNEPITFPAAMFVDQRGFSDIGELFCDGFSEFAKKIKMPRDDYREGLTTLGFRLTAGGSFDERPGDTYFAMTTSEVPRVDFDAINQMVLGGLISKRTATNLMLIDLENPVYSPVRSWIFEHLRTTLMVEEDTGLDQAVTMALAALDVRTTPQVVRLELTEFSARDALSSTAFETAACKRLDNFLGSVARNFEEGSGLEYIRLVGSRHKALLSSDHASLVESPLLLPVSDVPAGLVMQRAGTVGISTLFGQ